MRIRSALAVFFISIFILFPIRLNTLLSGIDLSDNLFMGGTMPTVFTAVLFLSVLLIFIITKKSINVASYVRVMRSIPCTFASIIMAGFLAYDSVLALGGRYIDIFPGTRSIVYGVSGILAAVALLLFAFSFLTGNPVASSVPIITLIPSIWACIRLTFMFMNFTTMANISVYYFDIGYYICLLIFLFGQAKIFSSIETRKSVRSSVCFGLLCCIFSLISVCTRFYINTFQGGDYTASALVPRLMDVFVVIYTLCYLFFITRGEHKSHKHEDIHFIHYQPTTNTSNNNEFSGFWNDWAVSQNIQVDQLKPLGSGNSFAPVNPANLPQQTSQFTQPVPVDEIIAAETSLTEQAAPIEITGKFKSLSNQTEQPVLNVQTAAPVSTENVQPAPSDVPAPADYYEDDDENISLFIDKMLLKSDLNAVNAQPVINGDPDHPTAHIQGTADPSAAAPVSAASPAEVPNYIETPDGLYVRVVDTIAKDQVVEATPDEAPAVTPQESSQNRPSLAKGFVPKSTVTMSDDGYCVINSVDE